MIITENPLMENFANLRLCYFFMLWQSMWQWHIFNGKLETTKICWVKLASSVFWQNTSGFIDLFWRQLASVFFQVGNIVVIKKKKRHTFLPHIKLKIVEVGPFSPLLLQSASNQYARPPMASLLSIWMNLSACCDLAELMWAKKISQLEIFRGKRNPKGCMQ